MAAGFSRGIASPCLLYNSKTDVSEMGHGDDFIAVGPKSGTKHLEELLQAAYKVKVQVMGDEAGECSEIRVLNRIIRRTTTGYKIEADPGHAERVVQELGLEGSKGTRLPGSKAEIKYDANNIFEEACVAAIDAIANHRPGVSGKGKGCSIDNVSVETTARNKNRRRVIHASDWRAFRYPEPSRRGSKTYDTIFSFDHQSGVRR